MRVHFIGGPTGLLRYTANDDFPERIDNMNTRFTATGMAIVVCAICLSLSLATPAMAMGKYALFEAVYDAKIKIAGGTVRLATTQNEDGRYKFEYTVIPGKLISLFTHGELKETTQFDVINGRPRTLEYTLINTMGSRPRNADVIFDWTENIVKGTYKEKAIDIPIPENAVDRAMLQLVLMADLKKGDLKEKYAVYNKDEFIQILVERIGEEVIKVPIGTFSTVVLRHANEDGSSVTILWCAKELGYLPVRIQSNDDGSKLLVANLSIFNSSPAE